eukprot:3335653-Prymnesium_polylepis.1
MSVAQYASWWTARGGAAEPTAAAVAAVADVLYLKDWHLPNLYPEYGAYRQPDHLADDWLNEHWASRRAARAGAPAESAQCAGGDHRFVYVGPAGSRTTLHADVLFSYSWSVNVCGTKRWLLVPDSQRTLVSDASTAPLHKDVRRLAQQRGDEEQLRLLRVEQ